MPFIKGHTSYMRSFHKLTALVDTDVYQSTTVLCDALYMGCPVLQLSDLRDNCTFESPSKCRCGSPLAEHYSRGLGPHAYFSSVVCSQVVGPHVECTVPLYYFNTLYYRSLTSSRFITRYCGPQRAARYVIETLW